MAETGCMSGAMSGKQVLRRAKVFLTVLCLVSGFGYVGFVVWAFSVEGGGLAWFMAAMPLVVGGGMGLYWYRNHRRWLDEP